MKQAKINKGTFYLGDCDGKQLRFKNKLVN